MATTSPIAFSVFRSLYVDLDPEITKKARNSRDYLIGQILKLPEKDKDFPTLTNEVKHFGSFSRKTKVRPLDDIDIMIMLDPEEVEISGSFSSYQIRIKSARKMLWRFTGDKEILDSNRVLRLLKTGLQNVGSYRNSDIRKDGVAVNLTLLSYEWRFDIVPAFAVSDWRGNTTHYLIPDGKGAWMKTDPRVDQTLLTEQNKRHNSNLIPLIRLVKYWNKYSRSAPRIGSYYLENMIINGVKYESPITAIRENVPMVFQKLASQVRQTCPDPKNLGANLDANVDWDTKQKVHEAAKEMETFAGYALMYEKDGKHKDAIYWWKRIFPDFPSFEY